MLTVLRLPDLQALRQHVLEVLCAADRLDAQVSPMREAVITRSGKPCGLFFQVHGPRLLRTHAIWAGAESRVLFYNSSGQRFAETQLSEGPDPSELAT
jgi:hypothetical protein